MTAKMILGLALAVALVGASAGVGVWAFFSDAEQSANNSIAAGTLDLKTDDVDGVTQTLYATNIEPGDTVGPSTIVLKNSGSVNAATLDIVFSYVESDNSPNSVDKTADETAAKLEITTLSYGGSSLLSSVSDGNSNGYKDAQDVKNADLTGQSGINAASTKNLQMAVQLRSDTGNDYMSDGITMTMTFTLNQ